MIFPIIVDLILLLKKNHHPVGGDLMTDEVTLRESQAKWCTGNLQNPWVVSGQ